MSKIQLNTFGGRGGLLYYQLLAELTILSLFGEVITVSLKGD